MIYKNNYSVFYKLSSAFRFVILKVLFYNKFRSGNIGLIGRNFYLQINKNGNIKLGNKAVLFDNSELQAIGQIEIGENFCLNRFSRIISHERVIIGNNVTVAQFVSILDHNHHYDLNGGNLKLKGYRTSPIHIGNNVWIGDKTTILKGVSIGDNVIVGANSLITKDIPNNSIVGGVPAKILKVLE